MEEVDGLPIRPIFLTVEKYVTYCYIEEALKVSIDESFHAYLELVAEQGWLRAKFRSLPKEFRSQITNYLKDRHKYKFLVAQKTRDGEPIRFRWFEKRSEVVWNFGCRNIGKFPSHQSRKKDRSWCYCDQPGKTGSTCAMACCDEITSASNFEFTFTYECPVHGNSAVNLDVDDYLLLKTNPLLYRLLLQRNDIFGSPNDPLTLKKCLDRVYNSQFTFHYDFPNETAE